jgi:hypothetical protein
MLFPSNNTPNGTLTWNWASDTYKHNFDSLAKEYYHKDVSSVRYRFSGYPVDSTSITNFERGESRKYAYYFETLTG